MPGRGYPSIASITSSRGALERCPASLSVFLACAGQPGWETVCEAIAIKGIRARARADVVARDRQRQRC